MNITSIRPSGQFVALKSLAASVLLSNFSGNLLRRIFSHQIPHRGLKIEIPDDASPRLIAALFWGAYESAEIRFVTKYLPGNLDVVELGSSLGGVSSLIAHRMSTLNRLICVEANPNIISLLNRNINFNAPDKKVSVLHGAISYVAAESVDFIVSNNTLCSRVGSGEWATKVPRFSLSEILRIGSITDYGLVCDIEGAEVEILLNDAYALSKCRVLIIELHKIGHGGINYDVSDLISMIEKRTNLVLVAQYGDACTFLPKVN